MMNMLEEAIIYATVMHQGKIRKFSGTPYILHPMEVAQILSTITEDAEIITAGILHDIVEDTDGTLTEIEKRFGQRVADLVNSESEPTFPDEERTKTWQKRKESSLMVLKNSEDIGVKMLWLADKLANIRSLARVYSEKGEAMWDALNQTDPALHCWYYKAIAENLELSLNKTGAFKELIKHINFIWPGTFDSDKSRYRNYKQVSIDGCKLLGRGAKGDVYRYDDELIIKVFNHNNTYHDVEQEIALSRKTFILGIPTAISFGIVSVGERYGAMYELADLAHSIHNIQVTPDDLFPDVWERYRNYVRSGISYENETVADKCMKLIDSLPLSENLVHGDFHTGNVFLQNGEPLLIDMDRVATGHPIAEISDLYYFYVVLGEDDPTVVEKFMGFSYQTAKDFFNYFLAFYLETDDKEKLKEVTEKASLLCYIRIIRKIRKNGPVSAYNQKKIQSYIDKIDKLTAKFDSLLF